MAMKRATPDASLRPCDELSGSPGADRLLTGDWNGCLHGTDICGGGIMPDRATSVIRVSRTSRIPGGS